VKAGTLNRRITIQQATTSADGYGEPIASWSSLAEVWAEVLPLTVNERFQAQQINPEATVKMRLRHRDDVTIHMRVLYEGVYYDIQGVTEIGFHEGLELLCGLWKPEGG